MTTVADRIEIYNQGRDTERVLLKYNAMRGSMFSFFRGSAHLFYEQLPDISVLDYAPAAWSCGDLHIGNYGSYKGDNRLTYFDINDFDEALLAPCTWDILRLLSSVVVWGKEAQFNEMKINEFCDTILTAYSSVIVSGKARWVERATSEGMVRDLMLGLKKRDRNEFIKSRTVIKKDKLLIDTDGRKALPASEEQYNRISSFMEEFALEQPKPKFFKVLDIARRVAGTGSLGLDRYVVLIRGKSSANNHYLLDIKESVPSSALQYCRAEQPAWEDEAKRVVTVQTWMQAVSPAFLKHVNICGRPYIMKELQPAHDKINLNFKNIKPRKLESLFRVMGEILGWSQVRSSGRRGSANIDVLIEFASGNSWQSEILDAATVYGRLIEADYREYCTQFNDGYFLNKT